MSLNIIDLIKGQLGPALVTQASAQFGESEAGITKAISGLLPAIVGGMANNAENPAVLDAISSAHSSGMLNNLVGSTANSSTITMLLSAIFGGKIEGLLKSVSGFAGISAESATSLLNMVTGAVVGSVGKFAADNNLGKEGISSLLKEQRGMISTLLPAGLSFASLGFNDWAETGNAENVTVSTPGSSSTTTADPKVEVTRVGDTHATIDETSTDTSSIWKWLLPLLLLVALSFFIWRSCENKEAGAMTNTEDTIVSESPTADTTLAATTEKVDQDIDLNGTMIKGYPNGMEDNMIKFLKANKYKDAQTDAELKDTWYNFDKVNFEMASPDKLLAGSEAQLENLAKILKAYPDAKIKIGGYTDKVGDAAINKELSQKRAEFLRSELSKLGVGAQITGAEGYGSEMATVDANASDDARAVDRNMAVRFAK